MKINASVIYEVDLLLDPWDGDGAGSTLSERGAVAAAERGLKDSERWVTRVTSKILSTQKVSRRLQPRMRVGGQPEQRCINKSTTLHNQRNHEIERMIYERLTMRLTTKHPSSVQHQSDTFKTSRSSYSWSHVDEGRKLVFTNHGFSFRSEIIMQQPGSLSSL